MKWRNSSCTFLAFAFLLIIGCSAILPVLGLQGSQSIPSSGVITYLPGILVQVDYNTRIGTNNLTLGTQLGDRWCFFADSPELKQKARDVNFGLIRIFTASFVDCTWNMTTHTGTYDWVAFDKFMQTIYDVEAEPLVCVGELSSRVAGGQFYPREMSINPETNMPYPEDYLQYTRDVLNHVKDKGWNVKYWEIFNEPDCYAFSWWAPEPAKMRVLIDLFNAIAREVHNVFPNALCGTDSSNIRGFLEHLILYGEGVGFLSFHKYDANGHWLHNPEGYASDEEVLRRATTGVGLRGLGVCYPPDEMREKWSMARGEELPTICTELNLNCAWELGTDPRIQKIIGAVWYAEVVRDFALRGVDGSLWFVFDSDEYWDGGWGESKLTCRYGFGMVADGRPDPDGIYPPYIEFYPLKLHRMLSNNFSVGDTLYQCTSSDPTAVSCLAWRHGNDLKLLLIGKQDVDSRVYNTDDIYVNPPPPEPYNVKLDLGISEGASITVQRIERTGIIEGSIQTVTIKYTEPLAITLNGYTILLLSITA